MRANSVSQVLQNISKYDHENDSKHVWKCAAYNLRSVPRINIQQGFPNFGKIFKKLKTNAWIWYQTLYLKFCRKRHNSTVNMTVNTQFSWSVYLVVRPRGHLQRSFIEIHILSTKLWASGILFHPLLNKKWCAEVKYSETVCILNLNL